MSKRPMKRLLTCSLLVIASNAFAQQVITTAGDVAQVSGFISLHDSNVLAVEGRKLVQLKGWNDELQIQLDESNGRGTFFLSNPKPGMRAISLQASDDAGGTYVLNLTPRDIPAELIVLKPQGGGKRAKSGEAKPVANDYQRAVKNMLLSMTGDDTEVDYQSINKEIPLWNEARFYLQRKYQDDELVGERYVLTNVSPVDMVVAEQELYRPGVMVVAVENLNLAPGMSTPVYIVRARKDNE